MAWVEKDHSDHLVSMPLLCAGSPTTRTGCPEPHPARPWMPPGMGHPQPLGQPVPLCHHSLCEKLPPNIKSKPSLSQFKTIPPCPITIHPCKQPLPFLFIRSLQVLEGHDEVSLEPSLLQTKQAQFPQPFLVGEVLQKTMWTIDLTCKSGETVLKRRRNMYYKIKKTIIFLPVLKSTAEGMYCAHSGNKW